MTSPAPAIAAMPYVSMDRVGKTYASSRGPVAALTDINLDIQPREFVSVVGPSGCGKSTLLKLVAGLEDVTSGHVVVGGKPLDGPPDRLGVVFQRDVLLDWRTILDNVLLSIEFTRKPRADERERALALLNGSVSEVSSIDIPGNSRAACASAPRSAAHCWPIPNCC